MAREQNFAAETIITTKKKMTYFQSEEIKSIKFGLYSSDQVEKMAVVAVNNTRRTGDNSVYDVRMGPLDSNTACVTCKQSSINCVGHYGFIQLAVPIFHPLMFNRLEAILRLTCVKCFKCVLSGVIGGYSLSSVPNVRFAQLTAKLKQKNVIFCTNEGCQLQQPSLKINQTEQFVLFTMDEQTLNMSPAQIYFILSNILPEEKINMGVECNLKGLVIFNLLVLPNAARPMLHTESVVCDDDLTLQYLDILKINCDLQKTPTDERLFQALKSKIAITFNNSSKMARYTGTMRPFKSIYERITGKEGQFRKHAMSKRADKTARTVISPNPYMKLHELTIPREIAARLTVPQYVSSFNFAEANAKFQADELVAVQKTTQTYQIDAKKYRKLKGGQLEYGDIIWRQLKEGDWVLFNRQPTLHAPSMQAMQIKINSARTFSFNLANTAVYNADMDGDEMNIHVPQSIEACVEMQLLSHPQNFFISDAHGGMNFGLVQDALLGVHLMSRDIEPMFQSDWFDLQFIVGEFSPCAPTPRNLLSSMLPADYNYSSRNIKIESGSIISGWIDKSEFGYGSRGLLLDITKKYGVDFAVNLLNQFQFVGVEWLSKRGYTIGISDCKSIPIDKSDFVSTEAVDRYFDSVGFAVVNDTSPTNNILQLIKSGSKGNTINLTQIVGIVGQQYINGQKVIVDAREKSLELTGFIKSCYYDGLNPYECWSHLIAARDAICKTATGTSVTGYLQRKLIKNCENMTVQYDSTIRSSKKILHFG